MPDQTVTLGPVFAAGFAVQQALELLTTLLNLDSNEGFRKYKKLILGAVSLTLGVWFAVAAPDLRVLKSLGVNTAIDVIVTALVLSAGTEGINSILKVLKYAKENQKGLAAARSVSTDLAAVAGATSAALASMNRK